MNDVLILDDSLILDYVALVVLPWLFFLNRIDRRRRPRLPSFARLALNNTS